MTLSTLIPDKKVTDSENSPNLIQKIKINTITRKMSNQCNQQGFFWKDSET